MASRSNTLENLRQAVLGNGRGREVEVDPSGEIRIADGDGGNSSAQAGDHPPKPSTMSPHTFGA
jgi:hypothetical protein